MKKMNLKEKDKIARKLYSYYRRAQLDLLQLNHYYNYYPEINTFKERTTSIQGADKKILHRMQKQERLENFIHMMDQVHLQLSKESMLFIENEYINYYDSNWYVPVYPTSTYYRLKHKALDELLDILEFIWEQEDLTKL